MTKRRYAHDVFPSASLEEIAAFQSANNVVFCDDYIAFLSTDNGLLIREDREEEDEDEWPLEVYRFYGLNDDKYLSLKNEPYTGFFYPAYLPFMYPVGTDGGGNPMVQFAAGSNRGKIGMIDHEVASLMEDLLETKDGIADDADVPFKTFADATPEQIITVLEEWGVLAPYEQTFEEHLKTLDKLYNAAAAQNKT